MQENVCTIRAVLNRIEAIAITSLPSRPAPPRQSSIPTCVCDAVFDLESAEPHDPRSVRATVI